MDSGTDEAAAKEQAEAEKTRWEARKAQLDAEQAERENAEWDSDLARRRRAAEAVSATAKAEQDTADSRQQQITNLVPKLAGMDRGETKVNGEQPVYGAALARQALGAAANDVAAIVKNAAKGEIASFLITSDPDLVTSDAVYHEVTRALDQFADSARELLDPDAGLEAAGIAITGAVAAAIPSVLSLLSAHRSITTSMTSADDLTAAATVAGALLTALKDVNVRHDTFRTAPAASVVHGKLTELRKQRLLLLLRRRELGTTPAVTVLAAQTDQLLAAIDQFIGVLTAVPEGAKHSMLTTAVLRESLHAEPPTYVLLVKAGGTASTQLVDDRPFMFKDRFSVLTTTTVTYLLVRPSDGCLLAGGTVAGSAALRGRIGDQVVPDPAPHQEARL